MDKPCFYEICIEGHLTNSWSDWFNGLTLYNETNEVTVVSGAFVDQAALFGVLTKIHYLNLVLISVNRVSK